MKLEAIQEEWANDSAIDPTNLGNESLKIPQLHQKYFKMFSQERLALRKLEADLKSLKLEKFEFYTQGPTQEQIELGWRLPPRGKILKAEVGQYIDSDKDIIACTLRIGLQIEKVDLLESIIKSITSRGFQIKTALDWMKFQNGAL